jgi:ubiquitin-conjugating enzyme E2 Z
LVALAVACQEADIRSVKALIIGPPETPYEFGFFEVCYRFHCVDHRADLLAVLYQIYGRLGLVPYPSVPDTDTGCPDYPANPPTVQATTTNGGRCRYNPNIYASGKVCL